MHSLAALPFPRARVASERFEGSGGGLGSHGSACLILSRAWGLAWKDRLGPAEGCWGLDIGTGHRSVPHITYSPLLELPHQAHGRKREAGFELQRG